MYWKFKFNQASCSFPGNPTSTQKARKTLKLTSVVFLPSGIAILNIQWF